MLDTREMDRWRRLTDAMLAHAAGDDPAAFAQVVHLLDSVTERLPLVAAQLTETGPLEARYSWAELAAELGVTKGAAWQRFGPRRLPPAATDAR